MEKNEFLAVTQQFMSQQGFQLLKKSKFYYEAAEFVLKFELQRSNYSELYYFDFNIRIKELHPRIIQTDDESAWDLLMGRMMIGAGTAFTVECKEWEEDCYLNRLKTLFSKQIHPILVEGLKALLPLEKKNVVYIDFKKDAQEYLETNFQKGSQPRRLK